MAQDLASVRTLLETVPGIPCQGEAPIFAEPWQAQVFAMALSLQQRGVFTWHEWAEELGLQIKSALAEGDPDDGSTYYCHWLATLERLAVRKSIASPETLDRYVRAWIHAADRTPHGQTIELTPDDFG
ncbi:nitrile hydratase accessory protein [Reyranella sp.]|jgi:nitrile hydratase accessory protein|uniref:nitrile hydratase accessory protein n=1 Tax=Reyranella sp. TaxID=1929291 RepID=UPI0040355ADE